MTMAVIMEEEWIMETLASRLSLVNIFVLEDTDLVLIRLLSQLVYY